ncbi:hypothetical protein H4R99_000465 [Coemansia sp. RSA 1722]|nr:hypothetical protein H4R99_000465 [Coemansia sp. RSA 1722]
MRSDDKDALSQPTSPTSAWYQTSATQSASALMPVSAPALAPAPMSVPGLMTVPMLGAMSGPMNVPMSVPMPGMMPGPMSAHMAASASASASQTSANNSFYQRSHPVDLPPEYSVVDPNPGQASASPTTAHLEQHASSPSNRSVSELPKPLEPLPAFRRQNTRNELVVDQKRPRELEAVQGFAFDRPLLIRTTNIQNSSLVIEHDSDPDNTDSIIVSAIITGQKADIGEKCEITTLVNAHGEYDFHVNSSWSMWSLAMLRCTFFVRVPPSANVKHPGIRIDLGTSTIETRHINNIEFDRIDIKTQCGLMLLNGIRGGLIHAATSNSELRAMNISASIALELKTNNAKISVSDIQAARISAKTSNSPIALKSVVAQFANIETTNSKIECDTVTGNELHLQTTNSTITSSSICADSLYMETNNAKIEGTWEIRDLLDICTSNSKIEGYILLKDPLAKSCVRLKTTNAKIKVRLPAETFSGTFDLKTTSRTASVAYKNKQAPPVTYLVQDKSYKKGSVGSKDMLCHDISARTSNSGIEVLLI